MRTMEHNNSSDFGGVYLTIILTAFSWFMNFITNTDILLQLMLHFFQLIAAICAILVALSTLVPPIKTKIVKFIKSFL